MREIYTAKKGTQVRFNSALFVKHMDMPSYVSNPHDYLTPGVWYTLHDIYKRGGDRESVRYLELEEFPGHWFNIQFFTVEPQPPEAATDKPESPNRDIERFFDRLPEQTISRFKPVAEPCRFYGVKIDTMSPNELKAVIGFLMEEVNRSKTMREQEIKFLNSVQSALDVGDSKNGY